MQSLQKPPLRARLEAFTLVPLFQSLQVKLPAPDKAGPVRQHRRSLTRPAPMGGQSPAGPQCLGQRLDSILASLLCPGASNLVTIHTAEHLRLRRSAATNLVPELIN